MTRETTFNIPRPKGSDNQQGSDWGSHVCLHGQYSHPKAHVFGDLGNAGSTEKRLREEFGHGKIIGEEFSYRLGANNRFNNYGDRRG